MGKHIFKNFTSVGIIDKDNSKVSGDIQPISIHIENHHLIWRGNTISILENDSQTIVFAKEFDYIIRRFDISKDFEFIWVLESDGKSFSQVHIFSLTQFTAT